MKDDDLSRMLDAALKPKREPVFGPNAKPVFVQFVVGLTIMFVINWLFWQPGYELMGVIISPLFR